MEADIDNKVLKRLDILISLQLDNRTWKDATDQERIKFLNRFELKPSEIAGILNKSGDQVSKQLYAIKMKKEK